MNIQMGSSFNILPRAFVILRKNVEITKVFQKAHVVCLEKNILSSKLYIAYYFNMMFVSYSERD